MLRLFSLTSFAGLASDRAGAGAGGNPSGPDPAIQVGSGTPGVHGAQQGPYWELLLLFFGLTILAGTAVLATVAAQRTRKLARRRARIYGTPRIETAAASSARARAAVTARASASATATATSVVATLAEDWRAVVAQAAALPSKVRFRIPQLTRSEVAEVAAASAALARSTAQPSEPPAAQPPATQPQPSSPTRPQVAIPVRGDAHVHHTGRTRVSA